MDKSGLEALKNDLITGKNLNSIDAAKHYKNSPQRIIYTIVKLCIASNGSKAFSSKRVLDEYNVGLEIPNDRKWNPIDHFSQVFTQIREDKNLSISEDAKDIYRRWFGIIEYKHSGDNWFYAIRKSETFDEINRIFHEVEHP